MFKIEYLTRQERAEPNVLRADFATTRANAVAKAIRQFRAKGAGGWRVRDETDTVLDNRPKGAS